MLPHFGSPPAAGRFSNLDPLSRQCRPFLSEQVPNSSSSMPTLRACGSCCWRACLPDRPNGSAHFASGRANPAKQNLCDVGFLRLCKAVVVHVQQRRSDSLSAMCPMICRRMAARQAAPSANSNVRRLYIYNARTCALKLDRLVEAP